MAPTSSKSSWDCGGDKRVSDVPIRRSHEYKWYEEREVDVRVTWYMKANSGSTVWMEFMEYGAHKAHAREVRGCSGQ